MSSKTDNEERLQKAGVQALAVFIGKAAFSFLAGLFVMLSVGVLHAAIPAVPTFGYWACVLFAYTMLLFKSVKTSK